MPRGDVVQCGKCREMVANEMVNHFTGICESCATPTPQAQAGDVLALWYELEGIIVDVERGNGFDAVCLQTIKRVQAALLAQAPARDAGAVALHARADEIERNVYRMTVQQVFTQMRQLLPPKHGDTHPAAASDDATVERVVEAMRAVREWSGAKDYARRLARAAIAALSSPDGLRKGDVCEDCQHHPCVCMTVGGRP